jgi:hypothetical protein
MKRILAIAALAILAACGGGNAQAQTIDASFKAQNGDVVNLDNAVYVSLSAGNLQIKNSSTALVGVADGSNTLYNKLVADAWFQENFVRFGGNMIWIRVNQIALIRCNAGVSTLYMTNNLPTMTVNDTCAAFDRVNGRSK